MNWTARQRRGAGTAGLPSARPPADPPHPRTWGGLRTRMAAGLVALALACFGVAAPLSVPAHADVRKADVVMGQTVDARGLAVAQCPNVAAEYVYLTDDEGTVYFGAQRAGADPDRLHHEDHDGHRGFGERPAGHAGGRERQRGLGGRVLRRSAGKATCSPWRRP